MRSRHFVQFGFVDDLDRHLLAGEHVPRQLDDGKVAGAECLLQIVQTSDLAIVHADPMAAMCVEVAAVGDIVGVGAGTAERVHISDLRNIR